MSWIFMGIVKGPDGKMGAKFFDDLAGPDEPTHPVLSRIELMERITSLGIDENGRSPEQDAINSFEVADRVWGRIHEHIAAAVDLLFAINMDECSGDMRAVVHDCMSGLEDVRDVAFQTLRPALKDQDAP